MSIDAQFTTESAALNAYFGNPGPEGGDVRLYNETQNQDGDGGGGGGTPDTTTPDPEETPSEKGWSDLQTGPSLDYGWLLVYREQTSGDSGSTDDREQWFVIRAVEGSDTELETINSGGSTETVFLDSQPPSEWPHYPTETEARDAYLAWVEANVKKPPEEQTQASDDNWTDWSKLREVAPWWIWGRSHETEDTVQFLVAGVRGGSAVYLNPRGEIVTEPHLFESIDGVTAALEAYFSRVNNCEIPTDQQPNGDSPSRETISQGVSAAGSSKDSDPENKLREFIDKIGGPKVALGIAAVAVLVYSQRAEGGA